MARNALHRDYPPPLPPGENERLVAIYQHGRRPARTVRGKLQPARVTPQGLAARDKLVQHSLRMVCTVAKRAMDGTTTFDDLFSAGCVGLLRAVDGFDATRKLRFTTYAWTGIWLQCQQWNRSELRNARKALRSDINEVGLATSESPFDEHPDPVQFERLASLLDRVPLDPRRRSILQARARYPRADTFEEIGRRLGISKERVRQLETKAIREIRRFVEAESRNSSEKVA